MMLLLITSYVLPLLGVPRRPTIYIVFVFLLLFSHHSRSPVRVFTSRVYYTVYTAYYYYAIILLLYCFVCGAMTSGQCHPTARWQWPWFRRSGTSWKTTVTTLLLQLLLLLLYAYNSPTSGMAVHTHEFAYKLGSMLYNNYAYFITRL